MSQHGYPDTPALPEQTGSPDSPGRRPPTRNLWAAAALVLVVGMSIALGPFPTEPRATPSTAVGPGLSGGGVAPSVEVGADSDGQRRSPAPTATPALAPAPTAVSSATPSTGPAATPPPTLVPTSTPSPTAASSTGDYLLIDRADLMRLPTSGSAWTALLGVADGALGTADLCDQNNKHAVRTFGVALVYARTGTTAYRTKARDAIMTAIKTVHVGCTNAILSLGRQLGAYVLAADLIGLSGSDDSTFRTWLSAIRTKDLGGHGRWRTLIGTHGDSANNWGAFAGASRIAADMYLGDRTDLARAAKVFHGFVGDRSSWSAWGGVDADTTTWSCDPAHFTPVDGACVLGGINADGAVAADVSRGGDLRWPPGHDGQLYQMEALQGLIVQAELLSRAGYPAWTWDASGLRRVAMFVTRADAWNLSSAAYHVPWLLNRRYGLHIPTRPAGIGRVFGYTDWLYGP